MTKGNIAHKAKSAAILKRPPKAADRRKSLRSKSRANSNQAKVVAMLRQPSGTTIAAVMKATGWQQHSVRGFFASIVRKKFGHTLVSKKSDGGRIYRIVHKQKTASKEPTTDRQVTQR